MLTALKLPVALFFILTSLILQLYKYIYQKVMECNNTLYGKQLVFLFFALHLLIVNFIGLPLICAWWDLVDNSSQFAFPIQYVIL